MLADGSEIEILTLAEIIIRRLNKLGVTNLMTDKKDGTRNIFVFDIYYSKK